MRLHYHRYCRQMASTMSLNMTPRSLRVIHMYSSKYVGRNSRTTPNFRLKVCLQAFHLDSMSFVESVVDHLVLVAEPWHCWQTCIRSPSVASDHGASCDIPLDDGEECRCISLWNELHEELCRSTPPNTHCSLIGLPWTLPIFLLASKLSSMATV